jgi:ATP-dependent helicase/DNAse subunit B
VFPAPPPADGLLSRVDLERLAEAGLHLGPNLLARVGHERFYAYIALTRTRESVVVTSPARSAAGRALLPSPFLRGLPAAEPWSQTRPAGNPVSSETPPVERLEPAVARALSGRRLETSASALEQAANCPLQHALQRVLRFRERDEKEYDSREEGTLQHQLLAEFHRRVRSAGRRWRDVSTAEATAIVGGIAGEALHGSPPQTRFEWDVTVRAVTRFLTAWLGYAAEWPLDPVHAELRFGSDSPLPGVTLEVARGRVSIEGKIDRVDLRRHDDDDACELAAIDYKLSGERFSVEDLEAGRQLQLPIYLLAASALPNGPHRGVAMVYASLSPAGSRLKRRNEPSEGSHRATQYEHRGRIDASWALQTHGSDWADTPFSVRFRKDGKPGGDAVDADSFAGLLGTARQVCAALADGILAGDHDARPANDGSETACDRCGLCSACRYPGK